MGRPYGAAATSNNILLFMGLLFFGPSLWEEGHWQEREGFLSPESKSSTNAAEETSQGEEEGEEGTEEDRNE